MLSVSAPLPCLAAKTQGDANSTKERERRRKEKAKTSGRNNIVERKKNTKFVLETKKLDFKRVRKTFGHDRHSEKSVKQMTEVPPRGTEI